jgi:hypothetical protein
VSTPEAEASPTLHATLVPTEPRGLIHRPSDTQEPVVGRRQEAWALAQNLPETADESIIPTLIGYLQDADAEVRWAGEVAVGQIAMSEEAFNSGLRAAVRANGTLTNSLFANVNFLTLDPLHREVRAQALDAIRDLYFEVPSPAIERLAVERWEAETNTEVKVSIVHLLCEHRYESEETLDVLEAAAQSEDPRISQVASWCLEDRAP